jgi:diaminohydroxyphosphoribosylaminopyrimidine deaminase/5-amino-6-(5-phosphoribosylamino)uracil reductase
MRAMSDAILVGSGTVQADNPDLRCRLPGCGDLSPVRVILDSGLNLSLESKLVKTANKTPVWIFAGQNLDESRLETISNLGIKVETIEQNSGGYLDLNEVMAALGKKGITRLMVEGGSTLSGALLDGDFIDELVVFESQLKIGEKGILPFNDRKIDVITRSPLYYLAETRDVGDDRMSIFRKRRL